MSDTSDGFEYGDLRVLRLTVHFENDGEPQWTCESQVEGQKKNNAWCGSGGWPTLEKALEFELDIARKRAMRQQ